MAEGLKLPLLLFSCQLVAFWPVWQWYFFRLKESPEALAIAAVAALGVGLLYWQRKLSLTTHRGVWLLAALVTLLYAVLFSQTPPLLRAAIALTALSLPFLDGKAGQGLWLQLWALLMLSLPGFATAEFYGGYPLRVLVAELSVVSLQFLGFPVIREGVMLDWNGLLVAVDAPCSGLKMLWSGLFLAVIVAAINRMNLRQTVLLAVCSGLLMIAGNVWRATSLFFLESGLLRLPSWCHVGIGLAVFGITTAILIKTAGLLTRNGKLKESTYAVAG